MYQLNYPIPSRNESFQTDRTSEVDLEDRENVFQVERQLFLRAALQLLDERKTHLSNQVQGNSLLSRYSFRSDVIRFGRLQKANRRNALTSMAPRVWKNKIVEIKYGIFYYEDESISKSDLVENIWRKSIVLSAQSTLCREVKVKGVHENCVFQLATEGGVKRTFLASTPQDRDAWMRAIFTAMILPPRAALSEDKEKKRGSFNLFKARSNKQRQQAHFGANESPDLLLHASQSSLPGPAAKYAQDINTFCIEQAKFAITETAAEFKTVVLALRECNASVRIPVFFVKNVRSSAEDGSNFALSPEDALSQSTLSTLTTSQIWKDLQRDQVCINGERVSGQSRGAEGIVAALTRHIMGAAQAIRRQSTASSPTNTGAPTSPSGSPRPADRKSHRATNSPGKDLVSSSSGISGHSNNYLTRLTKRVSAGGTDAETAGDLPFSLTEAYALACARDVLVLCNRTQSGGDTYFCVEAFLAKCGLDGRASERLCVLTPLETEADPFQVSVNIGQFTPGAEVRVIDGMSLVSTSSGSASVSSPDVPQLANVRASIRRSQVERNKVKSRSNSSNLVAENFNRSGHSLLIDGDPIETSGSSKHLALRTKSSKSPTGSQGPGSPGRTRIGSTLTPLRPEDLQPVDLYALYGSEYAAGLSSGNISNTPKYAKAHANLYPVSAKERRSDLFKTASSSATTAARNHCGAGIGDRVAPPDTVREEDLLDRNEEVVDDDNASVADTEAGTMVEVEDDDISIVSEMVEGALEGSSDGEYHEDQFDKEGDCSTLVSSEHIDAEVIDVEVNGLHRSQSAKSPDTGRSRDNIVRRRTASGLVTARSSVASVPGATHSITMKAQGSGRPTVNTSMADTTASMGHSVMEYEVKPKQSSLSLFKGKSFTKIFDAPSSSQSTTTASTSNANGHSGASGITATHSFHGGSFRLGSMEDRAPADTVHRRKSSLSGIYESQLSSLSNSQNRPAELVIRVQVKAESRYRLCCTDPQGDDSDTWATIVAEFQQSFVIHGDSQGVPTTMDRVVTVRFEKDIQRERGSK